MHVDPKEHFTEEYQDAPIHTYVYTHIKMNNKIIYNYALHN